MMIMIICIFQIAHKLSSIIIINIDLLVHSFYMKLFELWAIWKMFSHYCKRLRSMINAVFQPK